MREREGEREGMRLMAKGESLRGVVGCVQRRTASVTGSETFSSSTRVGDTVSHATRPVSPPRKMIASYDRTAASARSPEERRCNGSSIDSTVAAAPAALACWWLPRAPRPCPP